MPIILSCHAKLKYLFLKSASGEQNDHYQERTLTIQVPYDTTGVCTYHVY